MNSDPTNLPDPPRGFSELVDSRRRWIETVLRPWCRTAGRAALVLAEAEWTDLAGKAAPEKTLWYWAWSRYPGLCHEELCDLDETWPIRVQLQDGSSQSGFLDARNSRQGRLVLIGESGESLGPFSIDDIAGIERQDVLE